MQVSKYSFSLYCLNTIPNVIVRDTKSGVTDGIQAVKSSNAAVLTRIF